MEERPAGSGCQVSKDQKAPVAARGGPHGELRLMARQPIFNFEGNVFGYELLFRDGVEDALFPDGEEATSVMLDNTLLFGFDMLTSGTQAFVNCTAESIERGIVRVLPPAHSVLEILEDVVPTPSLLAACREMKSMGHRIALDDFSWSDGIEPLVELADFIKIDFVMHNAEARAKLRELLAPYTVILIAEKVETAEDVEAARSEGFHLFQGYFLCHPILFEGRMMPAPASQHLELMELLRTTPIDRASLLELLGRNVSLARRLLHLATYLAAPAGKTDSGLGTPPIQSIEAALAMVGDGMFRRMAMLATVTELGRNAFNDDAYGV